MTAIHQEGPDLASYDWIVVATSSGKDSQVALDVVVRRALAAGVDVRRIVAVHCDLGRSEWPGVLDLARAQVERYGVRLLVVSREQGDLLAQVEARGMWPSPTNRYCTSDQKRGQVRRVLTALARELTGHKARPGAYLLPEGFEAPAPVSRDGRVRILEVMGLRAEESPARAKLPPFERREDTRSRVTDEWLPIHGWTAAHVWERIRESGVPHHWAYDLGMPRLSCVFCIFAPRAALELAGHHNRELLREYVELERRMGHTFKADLALAEVLEAVEARGDAPAPVINPADWVG